MKKILYLFFSFLILIPLGVYALDINSKNAVLYNLNDDNIIYEVKKDERISIASMTKIMTTLVALEKIKNPKDKVIMTTPMFYRLVEENASVAGFRIGEEVTYEDLLYGLMLPSGADAAQALAISLYGSVDKFVERMNEKAKELGLKNTHFVNPTGLDIKGHYSSVDDVALILKEALKNDTFKKVFSANSYTTSNKLHTFYSTRNKYGIDTSFITGSKTGYTLDAGLCLASTSTYNGVDYLLVTAKASNSNRANHLLDAKKIYKYFQSNYEYRNISKKGDLITTINIDDKEIKYYFNLDIDKYLNKNCKISKEYIGDTNIDSKNINNNKIGEYIIKCDNKVLYKQDVNLVLNLTKEKDNNNYIYLIIIGCLSGLVLLLFIILLIIRRNKK